MTKANPEKTMLSPEIWEQVWGTLEEISDESGEEELGEGYLLKYEGWGGICVEDIWANVEAEQKKRGIDIESMESEEEREQACYEYAEEQSYKIIGEEWKSQLKERGYCFITGGHDDGGLYGRTWVLFKKDS